MTKLFFGLLMILLGIWCLSHVCGCKKTQMSDPAHSVNSVLSSESTPTDIMAWIDVVEDTLKERKLQ